MSVRVRRSAAGLAVGLSAVLGYAATSNGLAADQAAVVHPQASCIQPIAGWVQVTVPDSECTPLPHAVKQCAFVLVGSALVAGVTAGVGTLANALAGAVGGTSVGCVGATL